MAANKTLVRTFWRVLLLAPGVVCACSDLSDFPLPPDAGDVGTKETSSIDAEPDTPAIETSTDADGETCSDCDGDGYVSPVDCDDHDPMVNPDAYDFLKDSIDNDCDGSYDNPVVECSIAPTNSKDAIDLARGADICPQRSKTKSGKRADALASATWRNLKDALTNPPYGDAVGLVDPYAAIDPRRGLTMMVLSTGKLDSLTPALSPMLGTGPESSGNPCPVLRLLDEDCGQWFKGAPPVSFFSINDYTELALELVVPSNANTLVFDHYFATTDFNGFWGHPEQLDPFLLLVNGTFVSGYNVARGEDDSIINADSASMVMCPPPPGPVDLVNPEALKNCVSLGSEPTAHIYGRLGDGTYGGSGDGAVDDIKPGPPKVVYGGATGWLTTHVRVKPGEKLLLRIITFDSSDGLGDSVVAIDNFRWDQAAPKKGPFETGRPTF